MVSFVKATHLEKTNVVLDKVIACATNTPGFLETVGIFRVPAAVGEVDALYRKADLDPSELSLESSVDADDASKHNVTGLLKRYILSDNLQWSDDAARILAAELEKDNFNFADTIQQLLDKQYFEEAKMLHNVMHMAYIIAQKSDNNKMPAANMFQAFGPWLARMSKGAPDVEMKLAMQAIAATSGGVKIDMMGVNATNAKGEPHYNKTFDQIYPQHALALAAQHAEIPSREVKQSAAKTSASDINVSASIESIGSRITSGFKAFGDWVTKTALPRVRDFFTKTIPSWFGRLTGKKEPLVEQRKSLSESELPLVQTTDDAPKTQPWQPVAPQVDKGEKVVMGSQVRGALPNEPPQSPPPRPPRSGDSVRVRAKIVSAKIDPEEQTAIKDSKDKAMKFFKDLEQKGKDILPKRDKPKNKG